MNGGEGGEGTQQKSEHPAPQGGPCDKQSREETEPALVQHPPIDSHQQSALAFYLCAPRVHSTAAMCLKK